MPARDEGALAEPPPGQPTLLVANAAMMDRRAWRTLFDRESGQAHRCLIVLDVADADERVRMLQAGVGDAFAPGIALGELSARAERVLDAAQMMPRHRALGALRLDLFARDAFAGERPLGLHPREFALLWRLVESPGKPIAKSDLIAQIWRSGFIPDTNSLAVHVSRLRGKLALAGHGGLIETAEAGAYRIRQIEDALNT